MCSVSLCMIVKNEEKNIRRCLNSVSELVSEIVVVDTGSSDDTEKICLEAGAKVYDFNWKDDFSQARNFGLQHASCKWILWMDADEELVVDHMPSLRSLLENTNEIVIPVKLIHFCGSDSPDMSSSYSSTGLRLFRRDSGLTFNGRIHEKLNTDILSQPLKTELPGFMHIRHYGYMDSSYKNKYGRNLSLLLKEKEEFPHDPWLDYHLSAEYYREGKIRESIELVNISILGFLKKSLLPPSLAYKLKYDILTSAEMFDEAYPGIEKAVTLYPDYVDLHFYRSRILYAKEWYKDAADAFSHCLVLGESNSRYLIRKGTGSFLALNELGHCYEKMGKYKQAAESFNQADILFPDCEQPKKKL